MDCPPMPRVGCVDGAGNATQIDDCRADPGDTGGWHRTRIWCLPFFFSRTLTLTFTLNRLKSVQLL
jgi:hypothetical protein